MKRVSETILLPLEGKYDFVDKTPDKVFSNKFLGSGFVIMPESGNVKSPANGTVKSIFPTKHAIIIETEKRTNILIHIGLETVKLEGKGFEILVKEGQKISIGTPIIYFDLDYITEKAASIATPVVFIERSKLEVIKTMVINNEVYITIITEE